MAFLTQTQLDDIKTNYERASKTIQRMRSKAEEQAGKAKTAALTVGGGLVGGYVDGRLGALPGAKTTDGKPIKEGHMSILGFQVQPSVAAGGGLVLASFFDLFGKNTDDAAALGSGMLAGAAYGIGQKTGASGQSKGTIFGQQMSAGPEILGASSFGSDFSASVGAPFSMHHG
jgi:hypothetical protein